VQASNGFGWSPWSTPIHSHTFDRPNMPISVAYVPGVPHALKIHALHIQWTLPFDHGTAILEQELRFASPSGATVGHGPPVVSLDANTTTFIRYGFGPSHRVLVSVRMRNAVGWSEWSPAMFMITDPDVPARDSAPACSSSVDGTNQSYTNYFAIGADLFPVEDFQEPADLRQLRIFELGFGLEGPTGMRHIIDEGNESSIAALVRVHAVTDDAASRVLNISVNQSGRDDGAGVRAVGQLTPNMCYRMQLRSRNALGWGPFSELSDLCCTSMITSAAQTANPIEAAFPLVVAGSSVLIVLLGGLALCLWLKFRHLNARLFGGSKRKAKGGLLEDPSKKVEKYMDAQYTAGVDDADDVAVNPVLIHKIERQKDRERGRKKRAQVGQCGSGRTGGLARLNLQIEDKKSKGSPGKVKGLVDVEQFFSKQGVDVGESAMKKQTVAGKSKANLLKVATTSSSPASPGFSAQRSAARAAMRAGTQNFGQLEDEDDNDASAAPPKSAKSPGAKTHGSSQNFSSAL